MILKYPHIPVLVDEVLNNLITAPDGVYVDGTVGSGGHSVAIGEVAAKKGHLLCLDRDPDGVRLSEKRLSPLGERVKVVKANYAELGGVLKNLGFQQVHGIFLDLGLSTYQLEQSGRGFSFQRDELLDMRMDPENDELTAHQLVNSLPIKDLEKTLRVYGEEKRARLIAKSIDRERRKRPIDSSLQLANLIRSVIPTPHHSRARHPATRTFQALRIAINRELENLEKFLDEVPPLLSVGGRLVIISYHSLEDRLVKQTIRNWERGCTCPRDLPRCACGEVSLFRRLHKKGVKPGQKEIENNPRARSAVLRAAERS